MPPVTASSAAASRRATSDAAGSTCRIVHASRIASSISRSVTLFTRNCSLRLLHIRKPHKRTSRKIGGHGASCQLVMDVSAVLFRMPLFSRLASSGTSASLYDAGNPDMTTTARQAADLDRLKARIQALRAKTVENGCTEQEALAAAAKVADLLDQHDLSLSDVEIREEPCERAVVETYRRQRVPLDGCVNAIAAFCDCRVWREKNSEGEHRYVFFGLSPDVAVHTTSPTWSRPPWPLRPAVSNALRATCATALLIAAPSAPHSFTAWQRRSAGS